MEPQPAGPPYPTREYSTPRPRCQVCVSRRDETVAAAIDYRQGIYRTRLTGLEQNIPRHGLRRRKHGDPFLIEDERLAALADAVAEADAQCPVDLDDETVNPAFGLE